MQNLELKARYQNLQQAEKIALQLGAKKIWTHVQNDIYFISEKGKLKLRLVENQPGDLIFYNRPHDKNATISNYFIYSSQDPEKLLHFLQNMYVQDKSVQKTRTLYMYENVRIHLDDVKNLGSFIEFEALMTDQYDQNQCLETLLFLEREFKIQENLKIEQGYYELLTME